jgi:predicted CXXCH cytochrome family protein
MEDTCAACHSRRAELTGDFAPGEAFLDHFTPVLLDQPAVFAADGRAVDEAFEWNQFVASPMHAGGARCGDCHDPHSGRLLAEGDALCVRCHEGLGTAPHGEGECVDCHMPMNRLMARHDRRDHGFTRPGDDRYAGFERARSREGWQGLVLDSPVRGRRAAHVAALGRYPEDAEARAALRHALEDGDPLIPADADDQRALEVATQDAVRAVRVGAQRTLVQLGYPLSRAPDYRQYLDHNADDPQARAERGTVRVRAGDPGGVEDLAAAVALDPGNPELVVLRAVGLSSAGRHAAAVDVLKAGLEQHPEHVELRASLALALASAGNPSEAITAFEAVVAAEPERPRAWRNLALLYAGQGRTGEAKVAAGRAVALDPADTELAEWAARL